MHLIVSLDGYKVLRWKLFSFRILLLFPELLLSLKTFWLILWLWPASFSRETYSFSIKNLSYMSFGKEKARYSKIHNALGAVYFYLLSWKHSGLFQSENLYGPALEYSMDKFSLPFFFWGGWSVLFSLTSVYQMLALFDCHFNFIYFYYCPSLSLWSIFMEDFLPTCYRVLILFF